MGNRSLTIFTDSYSVSPAVYLHWGSSDLPAMIAELAILMKGRENDASYAAARFCGIAHTLMSGNLSLGLRNLTTAQERAVLTRNEAKLAKLSPGDAGLIIVDTKDFSYAVYDGYTEPKA